MIAEGTMQVPDTADLADTGVSATTENFVFTLQSMLVSKDSVLAIMRIDARTRRGRGDACRTAGGQTTTQKEMARMLQVACAQQH